MASESVMCHSSPHTFSILYCHPLTAILCQPRLMISDDYQGEDDIYSEDEKKSFSLYMYILQM